MLLAVNLVVRDEAAHLAECLASVREVADEVVVHDTGSSDATVAIARAAGARVFEGQWRDDFAEARNVALAASTATWVLSLDADERWRGDPAALRTALLAAAPAAAFTVAVTNIAPAELGGDYEHRAPRLFRRAGTRWQGRVHEEPAGAQVRLVPLPPEAGSLLHLGYSDPAVHAGKSARNAAIAQAELDSLLAGGAADPRQVAGVLLDLGRSLLGSGRRRGRCVRRGRAGGAGRLDGSGPEVAGALGAGSGRHSPRSPARRLDVQRPDVRPERRGP